MKKLLLSAIAATLCLFADAQSYQDSIRNHINEYVDQHGVVKGDDKKHLHFYDADKNFSVLAGFEAKPNMPWFPMATSGKLRTNYRVYGVLRFTIHDTTLQLQVYQSQDLMGNDQYRDYLFVPFTDATTGAETYNGGRYIDLKFDDIKNNTVLIDFNKAYNPYCAYVAGVYNCPIPPKENQLSIAIKAGEKAYGKH